MTATVSQPGSDAAAKAETAIRSLIADRERAMRTGDADVLASHYAPEAVQYDLEPPLLHGAGELRDPSRMRNWFAKFDGAAVGFDVRDLTVTAGEDIAFCHSLNRMGGTVEGQGSFEMWFRSTICFRREGEIWLITHEHESTPFYMDGSFLAATDLRP